VPDVVIAVDWSSAQGLSPKPRADRCWLAWASRDGHRSEPEYLPTRIEAEARLVELVEREHAGARVLIGFDFAMGYPVAESGLAVLPGGRELCKELNSLVSDDSRGRNNRFAAAAALNERIAHSTGMPSGPFWGCPASAACEHLTMKRPESTGVQRLREIERAFLKVKSGGSQPKSAWQLYGVGSVGGQTLVGLKYVHRLLSHLGDRGHLWPFEPPAARRDAITIAEIYPSMFAEGLPDHPIRDARQVAGTAAALIEDRRTEDWMNMSKPGGEGWILGVPMGGDD